VTGLRLIGLDLSLDSPGYAWTPTPEGLPQVTVNTVPAKDDDEHARIEAARIYVGRLLAIRPHLVAMEDIFTGVNPKVGMKLAKLRGVIEHDLWRAKVLWVDIHQTHRAIYATGNGHATKDDVLAKTRYTYGHCVGGASRIRTTDDADALILLAMTADHYGQPLVEVDGTKRRALARVKWPKIIRVALSQTGTDPLPLSSLVVRTDELPDNMSSGNGSSEVPEGVTSPTRARTPAAVPVFRSANPDRSQLP